MSRNPYPSDLTNTRWRLVAPLLPPVNPGGRPRKHDTREVLNGIPYVTHGGCRWRALPHDLPHWETCYNLFRSFPAGGTRGRLVTAPRVEVRTKLGRHPTPSGGCLDSQSAKTGSGGAGGGTGGGKRVRGRRRHPATATLGVLLVVVVTAATLDDGTTAPGVLAGLHADEFPRLSVLWAGAKYRNDTLDAWLRGPDRLRVEVTTKPADQAGFRPLAKRRVVGPASGCLVRPRRMVRDCERLAETSAATVRVRCTHRMARRARPPRGRRKFRYTRNPAT